MQTIVIPVEGEEPISASLERYQGLVDRGMVEALKTPTTGVLENQITGGSTAEDVRAYVKGVYWILQDTVSKAYFNQAKNKWVRSKKEATAFAKPGDSGGTGRKWIRIEES